MNCLGGLSLDDDDTFSNISRISGGFQNSLNSIHSDVESNGPVSVRDMIQHYNNQLKQTESNKIDHKNTFKINSVKRYHHPSQHLLPSTQSSYCGLNNYGSNINCCNRLKDDNYNHPVNTVCKNCSSCSCCPNRSLKNSKTNNILSSTASSSSLLMLQRNENNQNGNNNFSTQNCRYCSCIGSFNAKSNKINAKDLNHIFAVENCGNIKNETGVEAGADFNVDTTISTDNNSNLFNNFGTELSLDCSNGLYKNHNSQVAIEDTKNCLLSSDFSEEANVCQQQQKHTPAETSYQSQTTIAKTSSGVRIIIDIFFDQERYGNASDASIVGSRVETDIPQSRILDEFQQQTVAAATHSYQGI